MAADAEGSGGWGHPERSLPGLGGLRVEGLEGMRQKQGLESEAEPHGTKNTRTSQFLGAQEAAFVGAHSPCRTPVEG